MSRLEHRVLAEDRALLANDLLDVVDVSINLSVGAGVMKGEPERPRAGRELAQLNERAELRRAVHQVLQVRRGRLECIRTGMQL